MRIAVITIAGISSRFNEGIPDERKRLKAVYYEGDAKNTLLYHLIIKCMYADKIILVGGYKVEELKKYLLLLDMRIMNKVEIVENHYFKDLGTGYSLYLGLEQALKFDPSEILFVEGDLDIDGESFQRVVSAERNVLTYTYEPIHANKSVIFYMDAKGKYRYSFSVSHSLLTIDTPFSCILNSGQTWIFKDIEKLRQANKQFIETAKWDTNLRIIQNYLDLGVDIDVIPLDRWTNCNTRNDYKRILSYWENEKC